MKLLFIINTAGQAHTWKYVVQYLSNQGHEVKVLARDYGETLAILKATGIRFNGFSPSGSKQSRMIGSIKHIQALRALSRGFKPSMVVGFGIDAAILAVIARRPSVVFIDDDHTPTQNNLTRLLGSSIVTPDCFLGNLGVKHTRVRGYKELAYLHPSHFRPDITIFDELGLDRGAKYIILRFNVLDAIHDIGVHGFSVSDQFTLVRELEKFARIFISPEAVLHKELEKYRLPTAPHRIHHALHYAQMFVSDTGTMTTEAAILGTPGVLCISNAGRYGNFVELEKKYGLMYGFRERSQAIAKAIALVQLPHLKESWADKSATMLADKVDVTQFMIDIIEKQLAGSSGRRD